MLAQIVLYDGFHLPDAVAPFEVFRAAEGISGGTFQVELAALGGARCIPSGVDGAGLRARAALDLRRADLIVVPGTISSGSSDDAGSIVATVRRAMASGLCEAVRAASRRALVTVAAVSGGGLMLGMSGVLAGRRAVTHRLAMGLLAQTGAVPVLARVVDDDKFVTAAGVTSGLDVAIHLLDRFLGPQVAHSVEVLFDYERQATVWTANPSLPLGTAGG